MAYLGVVKAANLIGCMDESLPLVGHAIVLPALVGITHLLTTREAPAPASCKEAPGPGNGKC